MAKMFGKAEVSVDGQRLLVDDSSKLNLGGVNRNVVKGTEVYGFAEETMESTVDVSVFIGADTDLDALNNISDATITFKCDSGQCYVLPHAWNATTVEAGAATNGGKTTLKFCSAKAERVA
ncbi:phage tail tube protein [Frateuria sp. YIM B11624]|uniref:phage tail tube protein n=1 Tax=Frateuria sp. YIM B11624 TaxID=3143185 RepID=UPI003C7141A6